MPTFDLTPGNSLLLLIDVQERFLAAIPGIAPDQAVGRNCGILLSAAKLLGVPAIISEQVPDKLGPTVAHLVAADPAAPRLAKTAFSSWGDDGQRARIEAAHRSRVILCGIEAHVCVLATVADLIAAGREVIVASDAVASRLDASRDAALAAARDLGALVVPTESIVFRWQRQAGVGQFREIAKLVK